MSNWRSAINIFETTFELHRVVPNKDFFILCISLINCFENALINVRRANLNSASF